MRFTLVLCLLLASLAGHAANTYSVSLARDGRPVATIVIAKEPTAAANFAALELQDHVRRITGATLPIVTDETPVKGPRVLVGESRATRALRLNPRSLKYQESLVRFGPDTLVLLGRDADRPLTEGGTPRAAGKFGRALSFDGQKTVLSLDECGFSDEVGSLEAWVWMPAARSPRHGTILRMDGAAPWTYHIIQRDMNTDSISYTTYDGTNGHGIGSPPLAEGWHHIVATHDLAAAKMELFIDGKSVGTASYVKTTCAKVPLHVGALPSDTGTPGNPFTGLIDEVRVSRTVRPGAGEKTQPYPLDDAATVL